MKYISLFFINKIFRLRVDTFTSKSAENLENLVRYKDFSVLCLGYIPETVNHKSLANFIMLSLE